MVEGPPWFFPRAAGEGDHAQHGGGGIRAPNPVRHGLMGKDQGLSGLLPAIHLTSVPALGLPGR
jgi:hypothetical protein